MGAETAAEGVDVGEAKLLSDRRDRAVGRLKELLCIFDAERPAIDDHALIVIAPEAACERVFVHVKLHGQGIKRDGLEKICIDIMLYRRNAAPYFFRRIRALRLELREEECDPPDEFFLVEDFFACCSFLCSI